MKAFLPARTGFALKYLCVFEKIGLLAFIICLVSTAAFGVTFPGSGLGQIPDSPAGGSVCGDYSGAPLNITFAVTGLHAPLTNVHVSFTSSGLAHSWVGDLDVTLRAPGDAAVKTIFKQTGSTTATGCGDDSDLAGPYSFFDTAGAAPTWWQAAATAGSAAPVAAGSYRATTPGGVVGGGAVTPITPTFSGLTTGQINGTWTLRVHDGGQGDTGAISAASLSFSSGSDPFIQHVVDFNGDGKTDWVALRNLASPVPGQVRWSITNNGGDGSAFVAVDWGLATDRFTPGDFDGDNKSDVAVWRPAPMKDSAFYIINSSNGTVRIEHFGLMQDDPSVIGDYNNDGKDDIAVYRNGTNPGDPSYWYWHTGVGGPFFEVQWGQNGDTPAPGDYDGNGKNDFVVRRDAGGGQGRFWTLLDNGTISSKIFGTPTDRIVPGDYDGDGKTDIATVRGISGQHHWFYIPSGGGPAYVETPFGDPNTDFTVQGDYDGDGITDIAIWRIEPTQCHFYVNKSSGGLLVFQWGFTGDYPVANYNTH